MGEDWEDWSDDPLLRDLAAFAREEEAREGEILDERWDRLASGQLAAGEIRRLATGGGVDPAADLEAKRRFAAFSPLGPAFHDRVAARVLAELRRPAEPRQAPVTPPVPVRRERLTGALAVRRGAFRRFAWRGLAAAAALAAAVTFGPRLFAPPFPAYEVAIVPQGEAAQRSLDPTPGAEAPALFHAGTAFEVAVRPLAPLGPEEGLHGALEVRCFLQESRDGARVRAWPSCAERAEIAPTLAVRVAGRLGGELSLEPGTWILWIVLGRRGEIADLERRPELLAGDAAGRRGWIALRVPKPLRMVARP